MKDFELTEQQEMHFLKAFNNGYLIAQHEPELSKHLANSPNPNNEYYAALIAGSKQYELEKKIEHEKANTKEKDHSKDIDHDR